MTSKDDILDALRGVIDPELGVNIVDLGLVYGAARSAAGIEVALTMTSRYCPLSGLLIEDVKEALHMRFAEAPSVQVELVWNPPWSPDQVSEEGRRQLGWAKPPLNSPHRPQRP
jgi:metal-sulfur cluster biosynthetic enzyme